MMNDHSTMWRNQIKKTAVQLICLFIREIKNISTYVKITQEIRTEQLCSQRKTTNQRG